MAEPSLSVYTYHPYPPLSYIYTPPLPPPSPPLSSSFPYRGYYVKSAGWANLPLGASIVAVVTGTGRNVCSRLPLALVSLLRPLESETIWGEMRRGGGVRGGGYSDQEGPAHLLVWSWSKKVTYWSHLLILQQIPNLPWSVWAETKV